MIIGSAVGGLPTQNNTVLGDYSRLFHTYSMLYTSTEYRMLGVFSNSSAAIS